MQGFIMSRKKNWKNHVGKWGFPTSMTPCTFPENMAAKSFVSKIAGWTLTFFLGNTRNITKWGKIFRGQQSPSVSKIEFPKKPPHPRTYSLTISVKKFVICPKGDPESAPPFAPHQLFWKFGALAFPNLLSEKSEKKSGRSRLYVGLTVLSFIAEYQTLLFSSDFWKIRRKKLGATVVPSPRSEKSWKNTGCANQWPSEPLLVLLSHC